MTLHSTKSRSTLPGQFVIENVKSLRMREHGDMIQGVRMVFVQALGHKFRCLPPT